MAVVLICLPLINSTHTFELTVYEHEYRLLPLVTRTWILIHINVFPKFIITGEFCNIMSPINFISLLSHSAKIIPGGGGFVWETNLELKLLISLSCFFTGTGMLEELKFLISSCRFFSSCIKSECFKSGMDLVLLFLSDFLLLWFCWFGMWSSSYSRKFMMMTKAVPNCRAISQRCAFTIWTMANCRRLIKMSIDQKKMILLLS